jgi:thiol:disulfide interchange protein DsbA
MPAHHWLPLVALASLVAGGAAAAGAELTEGKDYVRSNAKAPLAPASKIEVVEFFSYGGTHSQELEPYLLAWLETLPPDVEFHRVPVLFATRWLGLAKVYYTLEALGVERSLSREVFSAIEKDGLPLFREQPFLDWCERKGLDRTRATELYNSPQIAAKISQGTALTHVYDVQVVPTVIVDYKFATNYERARTLSRFAAVLDALVAKARTERRQAVPTDQAGSVPGR